MSIKNDEFLRIFFYPTLFNYISVSIYFFPFLLFCLLFITSKSSPPSFIYFLWMASRNIHFLLFKRNVKHFAFNPWTKLWCIFRDFIILERLPCVDRDYCRVAVFLLFFVLALSARAKLLKRILTKGFFLPFVKFLIFQVLWTLPPEEGGSWMCQRTFPRLRRHKHLNPRPYNFCLEMYHLWMSELHIYCSIKAIPHRGNVLR